MSPSPRRRSSALSPLAAWVVLLSVCFACDRADGDAPLRWTSLRPGLEYARAEVRGGDSDVVVHVVRFAPDRFEPLVVPARSLGRPLADAPDFRKAAAGLVAVNAGYFDPQYRPLGLLVSEGRELSRLRRVDHGVFWVAQGRPGLSHARQFQAPPGLEFAVECGPRLVLDGRPLQFKPGVARRVAIGHDAQGRVTLAASEGVLSLAELGAWLARPAARGGPELQAALNLDGGSSTMFDLDAGPVRAQVRSAVLVPVGLAVRPRAVVPGMAAPGTAARPVEIGVRPGGPAAAPVGAGGP